MAEVRPSHEMEIFPELLTASEYFLSESVQHPGLAYEPISRIFSRKRVIAYRLKPWMQSPSAHYEGLAKRVEELNLTGLNRHKSLDVKDDDWYSRVQLLELQPARMEKWQVIPNSEERLYVLTLGAYDGEGTQANNFSKLIYSSNEGVLSYEGNSQNPIGQAVEYLIDRARHPQAR